MPLVPKEIRLQRVSDDGAMFEEVRLASQPNAMFMTDGDSKPVLNDPSVAFMLKAVYDPDNDGIVEKAKVLDNGVDSYSVAQIQVIEATAQQGVVDAAGAQATIDLHKVDYNNPHQVTPGQIGAAYAVHNHDASAITSGVIDVARLPASVFERLVVVADQAARFALTIAEVQNGDVVKQVAPDNTMYFVKDDTQLGSEAGYEIFNAGAAASCPWTGVTGKPEFFDPFDTGTVYFVNKNSPQAADSGRGTWANTDPRKPWLTVQAAIDAARYDFENVSATQKTVHVMPGTYAENVVMRAGVNLNLEFGVTIQPASGTGLYYDYQDFFVDGTAHIGGRGIILGANTGQNAIAFTGGWDGTYVPSAIIKAYQIGNIYLEDGSVASKTLISDLQVETSIRNLSVQDTVRILAVRATGGGAVTLQGASVIESLILEERGCGNIALVGGSTINYAKIDGTGTIALDDGSLMVLHTRDAVGAVTNYGNLTIRNARVIAGVTLDSSAGSPVFECDHGIISALAISGAGTCSVRLLNCGVSTGINLNGTDVGTSLFLQNVRLDSVASFTITHTASPNTVIKVVSAFSTKQILQTGLVNLIESPIVVIDPQCEV